MNPQREDHIAKRRRNGRSGHYCWACDRHRPNEAFTGKGHNRHVCRDCSRLGSEELAYRQEARALERCIRLDGLVPRKRRADLDRFLQHHDPRIRLLATQIAQHDAEHRAMLRTMDEEPFHDRAPVDDDEPSGSR